MFKSKSDTLSFLSKNIKKAKIPKTYDFFVKDWMNDNQRILNIISKKFTNKIVIRSSAVDEDTLESSNAGKYKSFLNVDSHNLAEVKKKIINVIKSYQKKIDYSKIMVQEMIESINCSGVVFNRDMSTSLKYYVINYDDISGRTDTVTAGNSKNSNRILFVYNKKLSDVKSKRFYKLLNAIKELEVIFKNIPLDIEFIITKKLKIYILQVRPLVLKKKFSKNNEKKIELMLNQFKKKFIKNMNNSNTVYGQMPDWNPAEIIGKHPRPLSFSLYKHLVLDSSWIKGRKIMGYSFNLKKKSLMTSFLGQPFIDVKKSFISFIPNKTSDKLKNKLVDFYLKKLVAKPVLHDKIEFEIAINSFIFDFKKRIRNLCPGLLIDSEIEKLEEDYKKIFLKNLNPNETGSVYYNLKKIQNLDSQFKSQNLKSIKLKDIIKKTIKFGIIPFSILARHAFIAENLLRSLERMKVINGVDVNNFKHNLETVTSNFIQDCTQLSKNLISFNDFKKKYGHLRPGTYDINSKNYYSFDKKFFLNKNVSIKYKKLFSLSRNKIKKINNLLKKNGIDLKYNNFFKYLKNSIELREYSKFIFTKKIDLILRKIEFIGKQNKLSKNKISYLNINNILKMENRKTTYLDLFKKISNNKKYYNLAVNIRLPLLLKNQKDIYIVPFQVSSPNYITKKKISSKLFFLCTNIKIKSNLLNKKIVLIENADPGFDWLFNLNIKGLITRFGGANSHMAIRCNELDIPAAIGVGDKIFYDLKNANHVLLDCVLKKIDIN
jgi:hypothetical protein